MAFKVIVDAGHGRCILRETFFNHREILPPDSVGA